MHMRQTPVRLGTFPRVINALVISPEQDFADVLRSLWPEEDIIWTQFSRAAGALESLFTAPPDLLVVDSRLPDMNGAALVSLIKSENVYRQVPVVLCVEREELTANVNWNTLEADDFLVHPLDKDEARARLALTLSRSSRSLDANPLSRLPGNTSIIQRIQELLDAKQDFALAYADLDHFKSFNDKYGFSRGDEALLMTARIIVNTIRGLNSPSSFVGHVGGDDFVFILPPKLAENACRQIVERFDAIVPNFYDQEDQERGGIVSTDRQGAVRTFPLMAISIAVVFNLNGCFGHYGQISSIAVGLKKKAKENPRSSYVLDQRSHAPA
jgi:diguanylate cyclase (GGDEF)-like protein